MFEEIGYEFVYCGGEKMGAKLSENIIRIEGMKMVRSYSS